MQPEDYRRLWDYSYWARDKLLAAAAGMTEEEYAAPTGFVYPSLRAMLTHMVNSESLWLSRWQGLEVERIREPDVPTLAALADRWSGLEAKMRAFFATMDEAGVARSFELSMRNRIETRPLDDMMTMTLFHQAQHRAEAAEALSHVDRSPGELDYIFYLWERGR